MMIATVKQQDWIAVSQNHYTENTKMKKKKRPGIGENVAKLLIQDEFYHQCLLITVSY